MAASSTSTVLGLSLWAQTDCPEWADFLQDNQKLEQLAGGHISNSGLYLAAEEKQFLAQRGTVLTYTGTGSGAASVTLPFSPRKITVFAQGKPPVAPRADGGWDVFSISRRGADDPRVLDAQPRLGGLQSGRSQRPGAGELRRQRHLNQKRCSAGPQGPPCLQFLYNLFAAA